jgi:hypothetical protein
MGKPKADDPKCDVLGCGMKATLGTKGDEVDAQGLGRKAVPNLNLCDRHANWAHSSDAQTFTVTDTYRQRTGA